jgi:hypothetical protein
MPDSFGTSLTWNGVVVAKLTSINGVEITADEIDDTTHQSPNGYSQSSPGLLHAGDMVVGGYFDASDTTGQHAMLTDMNAKTKRASIITFPAATGTTWTASSSYVKALKIGDAELNGNIPFTATIKVDGKPTLAVAAVTGMSGIGFSNDVLIMPAFAIGTFEYVVTILASETSTVITPVDASAGEIITIVTDGAGSQVVATGEASSACALDVDDVTEIVITISHATKAPKKYTFHCAVLAA